YRERHDYIVGALNELQGIDCRPGEGTFYAFPQVGELLAANGLASDVELVELLLNDADVACVPGSAFGAPGYIRLSFATSLETLAEAIKRVKRALYA
ncbi:MAG: aminotransferase class I/II-fold pyridoxal phosphate-dependent enzyme, partial [Gammaproteobacteria bacterium]|nr:aminotransferase class I/II-fold pyridoxal phosphate-dependent enzyme [Gammaproteobacteria bacterium]